VKFQRIGMKMWEIMLIPPGLQLFTVRNELKKDYFGTLKKIADLGYQTVELIPANVIGIEEIPAPEQRKMLDQLGLRAVSMHVSQGDLAPDRLKEQIQFAREIGASYIVLRIVSEETLLDEQKFQSLIALLKKAGTEIKKSGFQLVYHNHAQEFLKVNGKYILDRIFEQVGSELLKAELDLGWVQKAGASPIEVLESYKGRVELIHIKDVDKSGNFTEVGQGIIPYRGILKKARETGVKYFFVEQDESQHPLKSAAISLDYLKSFGVK